jgi:RND family efflux transporter MFP subunit
METKVPEIPNQVPGQNGSAGATSTTWRDNGEGTTRPAPVPAGVGPSRRLYWAAAVVLAVGSLGYLGLRTGLAGRAEVKAAVQEVASVSVATARREDIAETVRFDAEFRPFVEDELRAKVSGYLTNIAVDFGDRVKKGQLLAEIEVPELKSELDHARAAKMKADADHFKAHQAYNRLFKVQHDNPNPKMTLVPQQDVDAAKAEDEAAEAAITAAKADVERYQTLFAYTKIYAPYDGVITQRYADPGALIQTGTSSDTQSMPLVRISDNYLLRLDFPVSVMWVKDVKEGEPVDVEVESLGRSFKGIIKRFTRRVDLDTRKMWTEVEVPNPNLEMVPGMFAVVDFQANHRSNTLTVPIQAVSSGKQPSVFLVNSKSEIEERPVTLGIESPDKWEVLKGLAEGDRVIIGSRTQLEPGQKVDPKPWVAMSVQ